MDEKWLKLAEYCKGVSKLCQALAESIESQPNTKKKAEKKEEQPITLEVLSVLAKKKAAESKSTEVKAVITECGVKKLSDVPQEFYTEVFKKLEAI